MDWKIQNVNVETSEPLAAYAEERIKNALKRMTGWVRSTTLWLRDTDLSDLEAGRHVKVVVNLANGSTVVVDEPAPDFYGGIDRVAERLTKHLRQRLGNIETTAEESLKSRELRSEVGTRTSTIEETKDRPMDRLKNIIVVADFSEASDNAILQAIRIAQWNDAVLHVLHVIDEIEAAEATELCGLGSPTEVRAQLCERVQERLSTYVPVAAGGDPIVDEGYITFDVTIGDTFVDVLQAVDDLAADLLVVGHDRLGGPEVVGHLARRFARKAATKVMLVRPDEPQSFQRVVACVDFSEMSQSVIEQAAHVARQEHADLHIIHAPAPVKKLLDLLDLSGQLAVARREDQINQMRSRMDRLLKPYSRLFEGLNVESHTLQGARPATGLIDFLESEEPTLAVIGSRGRKNFKGLLMGSTAENLVDAAPCSTLIIKPSGFRYSIR